MKTNSRKVPFSEEELKKIGDYGGYSKLNTPITPKENLLRAIRHEDPLWIPMNSDEQIFCPRIIPDNIARGWVKEQVPYGGPVGGLDMFGVRWEYFPEAGGSMVRPGDPLLKDIHDWKEVIQFPDVDSWEWERSAEENAVVLKSDRYLVSWIFSGLFERLISFMDFENAVVALIDEEQQDDLKDLFQALVEFYKKIIFNFKKYYNIDALFFHDDWGGQSAPFFSPNTCREVIAPYIKQLADYCHSLDLVFDLHSCGRIEKMVPVMIECGVDKWAGQPINDNKTLIQEYGDKILIGIEDIFHPDEDSVVPKKSELNRQMRNYLLEYACAGPEKLFYFMNINPNDEVIAAFYKAGRILLS